MYLVRFFNILYLLKMDPSLLEIKSIQFQYREYCNIHEYSYSNTPITALKPFYKSALDV